MHDRRQSMSCSCHMVPCSSNSAIVALLQIVPRKQKLSEVYASETPEHELKLQLRALDDSLAESQRLSRLVSMAGLDPGQHSCPLSTVSLMH